MAGAAGQMLAVVVLAMVIASCRSPTAGPADDARTIWPDEPRGFVAATDQSWDEAIAGGWNRRDSSFDRIVVDLDAPSSPAAVLEYAYPAGFAGGTAPATHYYPLANRKEVFIGLQWKVSDPWHGHASAVNKLQFIYLAGGSDVAMVMHGVDGGPYELRVLPQWPEHNDSWLTPNVTRRPVALGRWHRVEWYLKYESSPGAGDGIIRWWLDGTPLGNYTTVRFPNDAGFAEYQLSPTWGGVGDIKRQHDSYRFDHSYISVPATGAGRIRLFSNPRVAVRDTVRRSSL
jgi:hypothetical protein